MIFKYVIIGDSGVGKSNMMTRYLKDEFSFETKATVGVEFGAKKIEIEGYSIKAQIWDTAGQERYKAITSAYYKGSKGALLVYDITKKDSFVNVDKWFYELKYCVDQNVHIMLIGNKCDLENEREITKEMGEIKAKELGLAFLETSALSSFNIEKAFTIMTREIFHKFNKQLDEDENDPNRKKN